MGQYLGRSFGEHLGDDPRVTGRDNQILRLLTSIESRPAPTQRMLAGQLQVALGTTNNLIRSLVDRKLIRRLHQDGRTHYSLTERGVGEKRRLMEQHLHVTLDHYIDIREKIASALERLKGERDKLVFYGAGDVAQIAYVVVANSTMELVGVVDDQRAGERFFGHPIRSLSALEEGRLDARPFDVLVIASFRHARQMTEKLVRQGFCLSRAVSLL